MAKRPTDLVYAVDENPPWPVTLVLGLQHVFVLTSGWIFVVIVSRASGRQPAETIGFLSVSMIAGGFGTILQSLRRGPVGSGYLCPHSPGPAYIPASILALQTGGFPLLFGMTLFSGSIEMVFSRLIRRLRALFPAEVTGTVVVMVGIVLVKLGCSRFMGLDEKDKITESEEVLVALTTLAIMAGMSAWGKGRWKLYPVLAGIAAGYLLSSFTGLAGREFVEELGEAPLFSFPARVGPGFAFKASMILPFAVACLASSLKSFGDLTLCQKVNDLDWKRPDLDSISRGILAGSLATVFSGLAGGMGQSTFSSNVGLSIATGATSRRIALACGGLVILLAFCPKIAEVFVLMPKPVMGAVLVYVASFMIVAGLQVIMSRMMDARKTFVVGISLIFGLSVDMVPGLYSSVPNWLHPIFESSLALATTLAIALNLLFRIGVRSRASFELPPGEDGGARIFALMEAQGKAWGARPDVIHRATSALTELWDGVTNARLADGPILVEASFDECNLDLAISYNGRPIPMTGGNPSQSQIMDNEMGVAMLAGTLIRRHSDRAHLQIRDGRCQMKLHYEH